MPGSRRVLVREDAGHTKHGLGRRYIYRRNPGMCIRTAQDLDVQGVWQLQIGNKFWFAGDQGHSVDLAQAFSNCCEVS